MSDKRAASGPKSRRGDVGLSGLHLCVSPRGHVTWLSTYHLSQPTTGTTNLHLDMSLNAKVMDPGTVTIVRSYSPLNAIGVQISLNDSTQRFHSFYGADLIHEAFWLANVWEMKTEDRELNTETCLHSAWLIDMKPPTPFYPGCFQVNPHTVLPSSPPPAPARLIQCGGPHSPTAQHPSSTLTPVGPN